MRYIDEINSFHDWLVTNQIPTPARILWFSLMHYCNRTGWKQEFNLAISALELDTGLSKSAILRARNTLQQNGRITFRARKGNQSTTYSLLPFACLKNTQGDTQTGTQKQDKPFACLCDTQTVTQTDTQTVTQTDTIPRLDKKRLDKTKNIQPLSGKPDGVDVPDEVVEILAYLNEKARTNYKANIYKTQTLILQHLKEGFTVEDFKIAINKKCADWLGDPERVKYLRPDTLFGDKFESYLNQPEAKKCNTVHDSQYDAIPF